jgi:FAD/FMN-containing dehydrogenase
VGKIRSTFLPRIMSQEAMDWNRRTKEALDPNNIFACGNQVDALEKEPQG